MPMGKKESDWLQIESVDYFLHTFEDGRVGDAWVNDHAFGTSLGGQNPAICSKIVGNDRFDEHGVIMPFAIFFTPFGA